ncbi:MAG: hypothetical protein PUA51_01500 [Oscillospiraceae bacterium]|nr:hypothetical protein [Oscillospiraceae bacterium]
MAEKYGTDVEIKKESDEVSEKTEQAPDISVRKNESKGGSKIAVFFITIIAVIICSTVVITLDRRNRVYNEITSANAQLATLESENVRIRSELDAKVSLKNVEEYAENVLHMKKIDNSQIEYIKIQNSDIVSVPEKEDSMFARVGGFIDKCLEYLKG